MNFFRTYFFNKFDRNLAFVLMDPDGRPDTRAWVRVRSGFQLFGGKTWTLSVLRIGSSERSAF